MFRICIMPQKVEEGQMKLGEDDEEEEETEGVRLSSSSPHDEIRDEFESKHGNDKHKKDEENNIHAYRINQWNLQREGWRKSSTTTNDVSSSSFSSNINFSSFKAMSTLLCVGEGTNLPMNPMCDKKSINNLSIAEEDELWDNILEYLFSREQRWKDPHREALPSVVPLSTMVEILAEHWEADGY